MNEIELARRCFLRACELDVSVRKPGNVSFASSGHQMRAEQFIASANAAVGPLFTPGASVGSRIEMAVAASLEAALCNTNLGIVLLCAPIAAAVERFPAARSGAALHAAIEQVLAGLDLNDSRAAYRAIARANPGGLGRVSTQDVNEPPSLTLRDAMALAASRDRIARQYRDGYSELFEIGLAAWPSGFSIMARDGFADPNAAMTDAVQRIYLAWMSSAPDSHIVRKRGESLAHIVMGAAQALRARAEALAEPDHDAALEAWDAALKADQINPGTSADLTVATLMLAGLIGSSG